MVTEKKMKSPLTKAQTFLFPRKGLFFYGQSCSFAVIFLCGSAETISILDIKFEGQFHTLALQSGSCYFLKQQPLSVPFM